MRIDCYARCTSVRTQHWRNTNTLTQSCRSCCIAIRKRCASGRHVVVIFKIKTRILHRRWSRRIQYCCSFPTRINISFNWAQIGKINYSKKLEKYKNLLILFFFFFRNLEEREKLQDRVRYLEVRILEKDDEMKVLMRRIQLDAKNYKSQLIVEQNKSKDLQQRLEKSVQEVGLSVRFCLVIITFQVILELFNEQIIPDAFHKKYFRRPKSPH